MVAILSPAPPGHFHLHSLSLVPTSPALPSTFLCFSQTNFPFKSLFHFIPNSDLEQVLRPPAAHPPTLGEAQEYQQEGEVQRRVTTAGQTAVLIKVHLQVAFGNLRLAGLILTNCTNNIS